MRVNAEGKHPIKIWASVLEPQAEQQLLNIARLPFIHKHVAVMPDAHLGRGSTVGAVIATKGAIIPAAVGVDIGCGMCAMALPMKVDDIPRLSELRHEIERSVPTGRHSNKEPCKRALDFFAEGLPTIGTFELLKRALVQLGSLGGGNHFIELCGDEKGDAWIVLHSGSRNIGKTLADIHIGKAKGLMKDYFIELPDPDLAYLAQETSEFEAYLKDLLWAQRYAAENRREMMGRVLKAVLEHVGGMERVPFSVDMVDCHHNYTAQEHHYGANVWVTRKGAVSARAGQLGIIPGSMGTKSYIVRGKGNPESFDSCAHGAGRAMSRTEARRRFTVEDLAAQTEGVECRKDKDVLDELPAAYKDIDQVMLDQADLVEVVHTLKQVLCVKGA